MSQIIYLGWLNYGARFYDAAVGRFWTRDRYSEKYSLMSPYQYAENSPVTNIDVNGDSSVVVVSGTHTKYLKTTNGQEKYLAYRTEVYRDMSLERYYQLKSQGKLPKPDFVTYLGRDALYTQRKSNGKIIKIIHSQKRYGENNETPPGVYYLFLKGTNGDVNYGKYELYIGDENGRRIIKGPDGIRYSIAIHGWDPRFSLGCLTTFEKGSKGGVQKIINAIPDLKDDTQPVRIILEPRPVVKIKKDGQILRVGVPAEIPYKIDEF